MPKNKKNQIPKIHLVCDKCASSMNIVPDFTDSPCPYCLNEEGSVQGYFRKHWSNHTYIEDVSPGVVSVTYSIEKIPQKFCTVHQEAE